MIPKNPQMKRPPRYTAIGPDSKDISDVTYHYKPATRTDPYHSLEAISGDKKHSLGSVSWHAKTGEIPFISTGARYQGLGVATTLWEKAHKLAKDTGIAAPKHSIIQTKAGSDWADTVGGKTVNRRLKKNENKYSEADED